MRRTKTSAPPPSEPRPTNEVVTVEMRVEALRLSGRFAVVSAKGDHGTLELTLPQVSAPLIGAEITVAVTLTKKGLNE